MIYPNNFLLHHGLQSPLLLKIKVELALFQALDIWEVLVFTHHLLNLTKQKTQLNNQIAALTDFFLVF